MQRSTFTTHYTFTTAPKKASTFYARVENCNPMYDRISIGARRKCLVLTVYKDAGEHPQLDGYTQNERCNFECNMTRGTPLLLKAGIAFMHRLYPHTRHDPIQFKDTSTIQCNHGIKLSLPHYYLAHHG